jgi:hypothetical protein
MHPVPDPAYHFDPGPDADPDPDFYLMRMRIQVTKMMRIHADPDLQHWQSQYGACLPSVGGAVCWSWRPAGRGCRPPCCQWRGRPPSPAGWTPAPASRRALAGSSPHRTRRYTHWSSEPEIYREYPRPPLLLCCARNILTVNRETLIKYITFKRGGRGESVLLYSVVLQL